MKTYDRDLVVCLPCYRTYEGRYETFSLAAKYGFRVTIALLHGPHPPSELYPSIEQITLPDNLKLWSRRRYWIEWFEGNSWNQPIILQDTFFSQMGFYLPGPRLFKKKRYPKIYKVLYLVSPTASYLFEGYWRHPKDMPMQINEILHEWCSQLPNLVVEWLSCRFADGVIGNTHQIANEVSKYYGVPASLCHIIPDEADPFFTPGNRNRKSLGFKENEVILLYVGNLTRRKGIDVLIKTLKLLSKKISSIRLVMVGSSDNTDCNWFKHLIKRDVNSKIMFIGRVERYLLREYYRAADFMLFPTRHEGSPRVVKEAMASGCPVICNDVPGIRIVDPFGDSVIYCKNNNPEEYTDAVLRLVNDLDYRQKRVEQGFEIIKKLMPNEIIKKYLMFYDKLISILN